MKTIHFYAKTFLLGLFSFYSLTGLCSSSLVEEGAPQPSGCGLPVQVTSLHWIDARTFHPLQLVLQQSLLGFGNNTVVISARNFPGWKFLPGSCAWQQLPW